jgi:hypothetical protein
MTTLLAATQCDSAGQCTPLIPGWLFVVLFALALVVAFMQRHNDD